VCYKFKSLHDSFVSGFIGVYGPNDERVRGALFEELMIFISIFEELMIFISKGYTKSYFLRLPPITF